MTPNCPEHGPLEPHRTRHGIRWTCGDPECTVACWDNCDTSAPADADTRQLRYEAHRAFDALWWDGRFFPHRSTAYRWLRRVLDMPERDCHIGRMGAEDCLRLLDAVAGLTAARVG